MRCGHVFDRVEYYRAPGMAHQVWRSSGLLDDGAVRRQIAMQHGHRSFLLQRGSEAADHILPRYFFCSFDRIADGAARDAGRIEIEQRLEFTQQSRQPAGVVEMLHVVGAGRLEVEQDRDLPAKSIEDFQVDVHAGAAGYGG